MATTAPIQNLVRNATLSDEDVVERVRAGETALYEVLMRRHNQRIFRVAMGILGNDSEAEDVMQETYVRAYQHLDQFAGNARFSTWLTRIAIHEALMRMRKRNRFEYIDAEPDETGRGAFTLPSTGPDPEQQAGRGELRAALEQALQTLPPHYRSVFVLRDIEELNTREAADCLGVTTKTVKIRLHRARVALRKQLYKQAGIEAPLAFPFHARRCDRVVAAVFARISQLT